VLNFGAAGQLGPIRWHDLQLEHGYHGVYAMGHGGALNDLLGVSFTELHAGSGIRYVLDAPGPVATSFAGEYDPATAAQIERLRQIGKSTDTAVAEILPFLDREGAWLTAVLDGAEVPITTESFSHSDAARLHELTTGLLTPRMS
jgi:hypothetical protein